MHKREHYIFDFDGTLVDSMSIHGEKVFHLMRMEGIEPPADILNILTPLGDKGAVPYLRAHYSIKRTDEELAAAADAYALPRYENDVPAKEGACEYLAYLKEQGKHLYILTASPHRMIDPCIARLGLAPLLDAVWSCEEFETVKSDPMLFSLVAERIGCSLDDIVFFDDNRIAVETAKAVGVCTVGVYDSTSEKDRERIAAVADRYVVSLAELIGEVI